MKPIFEATADGFDHPTQLPKDDQQNAEWQKANRRFWENNPMRYDWKESVGKDEFSLGFYDEIDKRFFESSRPYAPWKVTPFEKYIDFDSLKNKDVLEIGVGNGSHAELLARHSRSFTGIDLTNYATESTSRRFELKGIPGAIKQMDAERLEFADNSFDFVWSWGVIHHSANTKQILREIGRVLRPGGKATIMVYNRCFWHKYILAGLFHGLIRGQLFREKSLSKVLQNNTDGAIARYYKPAEWRKEAEGSLAVDRIQFAGNKPEVLPIPGGKVKSTLLNLVPDACARVFTNTLGQGMFLIADMSKPN